MAKIIPLRSNHSQLDDTVDSDDVDFYDLTGLSDDQIADFFRYLSASLDESDV